MVAAMEGDVLILASTANFKVRKTCFLEENRSAVVGGLKRCA